MPNLACVESAFAMFVPLLQKAGTGPVHGLFSAIPKVLMVAAMVGGTGSLLSAGSAQAQVDRGAICTFGTSLNPAPACVIGSPYILNDKILTLIQGPAPGDGFIDFLSAGFPSPGPEGETWNVKTNFAPGFGPGGQGEFRYEISINQAKEPSVFFKAVAIDSQHEGSGVVVTKTVYASLADLNLNANATRH